MKYKGLPPIPFTTSAFLVGIILTDDLNAQQQNDLGNWLMLAAQVLCTNAARLSAISNRNSVNSSPPTREETIQMLQKTINAMQQEINNLKNL